ncbi:lasso RiPP family leader peptide-containing protein [Micromonospora schwarzwaldensis]|uniref:lasso RiPP family leader peptide-containing protein n=1 Tax=Micromonospora sp. DSM 45708 TaxID=3111767 RepID=UPI0031D6A658
MTPQTPQTTPTNEQQVVVEGYRPPRLTRLGTLADLTRGGELPVGDGQGGSGASI